MQINTDIIVVGAGPAGCISALLLSEKYNVTIIEAHKFPRKKSCSGVLIKKSVEIVEKYFGEIPQSAMCSPQKTTGINIINLNGEVIKSPDDGVNIQRDEFDNWMLENVKKKGVQVLEGYHIVCAKQNERHYISAQKRKSQTTIISDYIIACDGIHGTSRRFFGAPKQNKIVTVQRFFEGKADIDPTKFYAYTSSAFSQYDAWVNSKNGEIIIGSIAFNKKTAIKYLDTFIDHLRERNGFCLTKQLRQETWAIPFVLPNLNILFHSNNVFFAGEAAGFLNPFGEGISSAFMSGIAIAQSILESDKENKVDISEIEKSYKLKMNKEVQYMERQWNLLKYYSPGFWENSLKCFCEFENSPKVHPCTLGNLV